MKRQAVTLVVAVVIAAGAAGCAGTRRQSIPPVPKASVDPARVVTDETECATYAEERPSDVRYASYVACLVGRGYRTHMFLLRYGSVTGVTVHAERERDTEKVFRDLTTCAARVDTQVDVPPSSGMYMGLPSMILARASYQASFAECIAPLGYTTMDGDKPLAVAGTSPVAAPVAPVTRAAPAPLPPPPAPAPVTPHPAPAPAFPPPAVTATVVPPAAAPPAAVAPAARPTARVPPGLLGQVTLGLHVDPFISPPVVIVVMSNTPAGKAGVRPGDIVLAIDEIPITSHRDIAKVLSTKIPGDVLKIDVQRGRQRLTLEPTLVAR